MKKLVIILVLVSYGFSSFGVRMHLQYCCGKLESFNFSSPNRMHCTGSKSHLSKPCCENKDVFLKLHGEQETSKIFHPCFKGHAISHQTVIVLLPVERKLQTSTLFNQPPTGSPPVFILNCVFRI